MKNILRGIAFWTILMGFILAMFGTAEILSNLITMEMLMPAVYVALGFSFIYILKN